MTQSLTLEHSKLCQPHQLVQSSAQPPTSKRRPQQSISTPTKREEKVHLISILRRTIRSGLIAHIVTQRITSSAPAPNSKPSPLKVKWIQEHKQCWWCALAHVPDSCTLRNPYNTCKEQHLTVLHNVAQQCNQSILMVQVPPKKLYMDRPSHPNKVML